MTENAHDDLLIRYLDGELTAGEKATLEERLRTDKYLQERLQNLKVAVQAVHQWGTAQKVQTIHVEMMKGLKRNERTKVIAIPKTLRYALAVAASVVVLFFGVKLYQAAQLSPERLYKENFVDFNLSSSRGNGGQPSEIEKHYRLKEYEAITTGVRSLNMDAKDSLLTGLAYLQAEQLPQAIGFLQSLAFSANDYRQDAEFYLALSYLKNKAYNKALPLMEKISANPSHLYHEQLSTDAIAKVKKLAAN